MALASNLTGNRYESQVLALVSDSELEAIETDTSYSEENPVRSYTLSGWAKADSLKLKGKRTFGLQAIVEYAKPGETTREFEYFDVSFNDGYTGWQFVSIPIMTDPEKGYPVQLYVTCQYRSNQGTAYFDDITLIPNADTVNYAYDSEGRVVATKNGNGYASSQTTYYPKGQSENGGEVDTITYADGRKTQYTYEKHKVSSVWNYDKNEELISYHYTGYDTWGNPDYIAESGDEESSRLAITLNTYSEAGRTFGKLLTQEENTGFVTTYHYDNVTGYLMAVTYSDGTGVAYTYDKLGRQLSSRPASVSGTGYSSESSSERALFTYEGGALSTITTATAVYSFDYDAYGNQRTVEVGDGEIARYIYNAGNGKLKYVVYGNGYVVRNVYDHLERLTEIWYTQVTGTLPTSDSAYDSYSYTKACEYVYDSRGYVEAFVDYVADEKYAYEYDPEGKPVRVVRYNGADGTVSVEYLEKAVYNTEGLLSTYTAGYRLGGSTYTDSRSYIYDELNRVEALYFGGLSASDRMSYAYDDMRRIESVTTVLGGVTQKQSYGYRVAEGSYGETETGQVETNTVTVTTGSAGTTTTYHYTYDGKGNITEIRIGGVLKYRYSYDNLGQLIREDNAEAGKSWFYSYDNAGNLKSRKSYNYTTGAVGSLKDSRDYLYLNGSWGDQLSRYDGGSMTYDALGNPLTYYNGTSYTMSWTKGRLLSGLTKGTTTASYSYNADGIRIGKI